MSVVLDASAALALLWNEPGRDAVLSRLDGALISTVNMAEIYAKSGERSQEIDAVRRVLQNMPIEVRPFDEPHALLSGRLRAQTRSLGLSLGDRACLATAMIERCAVMTADRAWLNLGLSVEVIAIR